MIASELISLPLLRSSGRMVRLSSCTDPTVDDDGGTLAIGTELLHDDTGKIRFWDGTAWKPIHFAQKLCQGVDLLIELRDLLDQGD